MDMDIPAVLGKIRPGASWGMLGPSNDYNSLDWRDKKQKKPTLKEIEAAWPEVEAEIQRVVARVTSRESVRGRLADAYQLLPAHEKTLG